MTAPTKSSRHLNLNNFWLQFCICGHRCMSEKWISNPLQIGNIYIFSNNTVGIGHFEEIVSENFNEEDHIHQGSLMILMVINFFLRLNKMKKKTYLLNYQKCIQNKGFTLFNSLFPFINWGSNFLAIRLLHRWFPSNRFFLNEYFTTFLLCCVQLHSILHQGLTSETLYSVKYY